MKIKQPIATNGRIYIYGIKFDINDRIVWKHIGEEKFHSSTLYYTDKDEIFFKDGNNREYLNEYIKF